MYLWTDSKSGTVKSDEAHLNILNQPVPLLELGAGLAIFLSGSGNYFKLKLFNCLTSKCRAILKVSPLINNNDFNGILLLFFLFLSCPNKYTFVGEIQ